MENRKRMLLLCVVLMVVSLSGSAALALAPMGPPTAGLKQGQLSAALEFSNSNMNLAVAGGGNVRNVNSNTLYANLGYGIMDNCETSLLLGVANADFAGTFGAVPGRVVGDTGFVLGFRTKATFYEDEPGLKLGALFQMAWSDLDGTAKSALGSTPATLDTREIQIAVGPTYLLREGVSIYGGPFFHLLRGDFNIPGAAPAISADIHEAYSFGGYVGTEIDITENLAFNIEWQYTGAPASALGAGLIWRF